MEILDQMHLQWRRVQITQKRSSSQNVESYKELCDEEDKGEDDISANEVNGGQDRSAQEEMKEVD